MYKIKTFTSELKPFHTKNELDDLDAQVNQYILENKIEEVISVSDTCTSGDSNTIGIIRVLTYRIS